MNFYVSFFILQMIGLSNMLLHVTGEGTDEDYKKLSNKLVHLDEKVNKIKDTTSQIFKTLTQVDCSDLKDVPSGEYSFQLDHEGKRPVKVWCDQDTDGGGWTVIQQRKPKATAESPLDFNKSWYDYKIGFGTPSDDYWVGLQNIHIWTNSRHYELRIELTSFGDENTSAFAHYKEFYLENEDNNYRIHVSGYKGTAGDALTGKGTSDKLRANGMMFTTKDKDNDLSKDINCSTEFGIGGWWFSSCSWANLNGPYYFPDENKDGGIGINWHTWKKNTFMKSAVMKIRPANRKHS